MYYVTTAGGYIGECEYGFGYIKELFTKMFGIREARLIKAEGLDIRENNPEDIIFAAKIDMEKLNKLE